MSNVDAITAVRTPDELYALLDPEVMWYSSDVNSNFTCNDREDVVACIERNLEWETMTGRFDVVAARDDCVVVRPVVESREFEHAMLLRFRDELIIEMRDFGSAAAACRYAGVEEAAV